MNKIKYLLILLLIVISITGCEKAGDVQIDIEYKDDTNDTIDEDFVLDGDPNLDESFNVDSVNNEKSNIKSLLDNTESTLYNDITNAMDKVVDDMTSGLDLLSECNSIVSGSEAYDIVKSIAFHNYLCDKKDILTIVLVPYRFITEYEDNIILTDDCISYYGICSGYPIGNESNVPIYIKCDYDYELSSEDHGAKDLYERYNKSGYEMYIVRIDTKLEPFGTEVKDSAMWLNGDTGYYVGNILRGDNFERVDATNAILKGYYKPTKGSPIAINEDSTYELAVILDKDENVVGIVLLEDAYEIKDFSELIYDIENNIDTENSLRKLLNMFDDQVVTGDQIKALISAHIDNIAILTSTERLQYGDKLKGICMLGDPGFLFNYGALIKSNISDYTTKAIDVLNYKYIVTCGDDYQNPDLTWMRLETYGYVGELDKFDNGDVKYVDGYPEYSKENSIQYIDDNSKYNASLVRDKDNNVIGVLCSYDYKLSNKGE